MIKRLALALAALLAAVAVCVPPGPDSVRASPALAPSTATWLAPGRTR